MGLIKKQWISPYKLVPQSSQQMDREGALLRIEYMDGQIGYADCHPWTSFGDEPLVKQIDVLKQRGETPLLRASLAYACIDAQARSQQIALLSPQTHIKSHWLSFKGADILDGFEEGFTHFKVKDWEHIEQWMNHLPPHHKLRIDFNCSLTREQFEMILDKLDGLLHRFDFFEDPFPYDEVAWQEVQQKYRIALACDLDVEKAIGKSASASVLVVKPARQILAKKPKDQRVVVTSYLDHPLGQTAAAYAANLLGCTEVCGLNSHRVYQKTPFSEQLAQKGAVFTVPKGTGFGFDDLLTKINWQEI